MICEHCRKKRPAHGKCPGGNWCDCQHVKRLKPIEPVRTPVRTGSAQPTYQIPQASAYY